MPFYFLEETMTLSSLKGLGPKKKELLHSLGIDSARDLLMHFPRSYQDRSKPLVFFHGEEGFVEARVVRVQTYTPPGRKKVLSVYLQAEEGAFEAVFFQAPYLEHAFKFQEDYLFYGTLEKRGTKLQMIHPVFASTRDRASFAGIIPIYKTLKGLSQKDIQHFVDQLLQGELEEFFRAEDLRKWDLLPIRETLQEMHQPSSRERFKAAKYRLIFEEFFKYLLLHTAEKEENKVSYKLSDALDQDFVSQFSFPLTGDQQEAMKEIRADLSSGVQMQRLLQGDVGSGKSLVAYYALYLTEKSGYQGVYLAPTELLANQQFRSIKQLFSRAELLTAATKDKAAIKERIRSGEASMVVGTHALLEEDVVFKDLQMIITDEQHRFGVNQRKKLQEKAPRAHHLMMSATPIPRTMSMMLHRHLDVSNLRDMPEGRIPIVTKVIPEKNRFQAYAVLKEEIQKNHQGFIVFPLIEESEALGAQSLEENMEELSEMFPEDVAFLHGKMTSDEKRKIISDFEHKKYHILAATTLIEVGINVPDATVMIIRSANRFGLSQTHQIRGRIGRSHLPSTCYLCFDGREAPERLYVLEKQSSGFIIAEEDLRLRGPGEITGVKQSGIYSFTHADIYRHEPILEKVSSLISEEVITSYQDRLERLQL